MAHLSITYQEVLPGIYPHRTMGTTGKSYQGYLVSFLESSHDWCCVILQLAPSSKRESPKPKRTSDRRPELRRSTSVKNMSVLIVTGYGEMVIDLFVQRAPIACTNFLKLCKLKYYNNVLIYHVQENFLIQTGDPTGTGKGGESVYGMMYGEQAKYFEDEIIETNTCSKTTSVMKGLLGMANLGPNLNTSQIFLTTSEDVNYYTDAFSHPHTIFGQVMEGLDVLEKINTMYTDAQGRPLIDMRILHTYVLEDPFPDPEAFRHCHDMAPHDSPKEGQRPAREALVERLTLAESLLNEIPPREEGLEMNKSLEVKEAQARAVFLETTGDIPDADIRPPDEVLFVCKLNHVTSSEDLELIFSRFGKCRCEIITDYKTRDSLCFGFVEFDRPEHCEEAYFKMNNVLIDDRRIKVDFSQSVSKLWNQVRRKENISELNTPLHSDEGARTTAYARARPSHRRAREEEAVEKYDFVVDPEDHVSSKGRTSASHKRKYSSHGSSTRRRDSRCRRSRSRSRKSSSSRRYK